MLPIIIIGFLYEKSVYYHVHVINFINKYMASLEKSLHSHAFIYYVIQEVTIITYNHD